MALFAYPLTYIYILLTVNANTVSRHADIEIMHLANQGYSDSRKMKCTEPPSVMQDCCSINFTISKHASKYFVYKILPSGNIHNFQHNCFVYTVFMPQ